MTQTLVYNNGYHLFYQFNPFEISGVHDLGACNQQRFGTLKHLPVAIPEERMGTHDFFPVRVVDVLWFCKMEKCRWPHNGHIENVNQSQQYSI
jgi:hypothetical protein